jgi:hypothetical protein
VHALEVARFQRVVADGHGQPAQCRIKGWPFRNGPRAQDLADLNPEIEMQPRRVMQLHDKTGGRHPATVPSAIRGRGLGRRGRAYWAAVRREGHRPMPRTDPAGAEPAACNAAEARAVRVAAAACFANQRVPAWQPFPGCRLNCYGNARRLRGDATWPDDGHRKVIALPAHKKAVSLHSRAKASRGRNVMFHPGQRKERQGVSPGGGTGAANGRGLRTGRCQRALGWRRWVAS